MAELPPAQRARWIGLIAICLGSALLGRFCYLVHPLDSDAAMFIYMGKMVSEGGRLCHDLIDNKFPTVGLMFTLLWKTLGTYWPAYIALQTILALSCAWILSGMAARHIGQYARLPTMLFAIVYLNFTTAVFGGFQLETVQVFFAILAARSALIAMESDNPADMFVAGLCAGCGAMFKPTGLAVLVAGAGGIWLTHRHMRYGIRLIPHLLAGALGVAIPAAVAFAYLIGADLLGDMPGLYRQISTYASQTALSGSDFAKPAIAATIIGFPLFVRGWVCRRQREGIHSPDPDIVGFVLIWLFAEIIGVLMQRRMYAYHFLPIVPPAALLFGLIPRAARPMSLAAALFPTLVLSVHDASGILQTPYSPNSISIESNWLRTHAARGDAIWMDAWPRVVLETDLQPGSSLALTFLFVNYDTAGLDYSAQMIADFQRTRPRYLFLPFPLEKRLQNQVVFVPELIQRPLRRANFIEGWHRIHEYALAHYTPVGIVDGQEVFRRNTETAPDAAARAD